MKSIVVASLLTVGVLASQGAVAANPVTIKWAGVDMAGTKLSTMDDAVSTDVALTSNYATTALNYSYVASGESFVAYCIEPTEGNGRAMRDRIYNVESFSGAQAQQLQGLFSSSYAGLTTYNDKAAFQLAIWELVRETSGTFSIGGGSFHLLGDDATTAAVTAKAGSFLAQALSYSGSAHYSLTKLTNDGLQDLVVATAITAVPEPESYALFLAGLGVMGLLARRRLPR
ncbi:PEP-CTERM sorting domain-containing protein [Roseateles sp.]|uniref:PEP-CTERM sorting domain-containing protein n=1 Tax=Roseateles sp. TaxID=1971397 RepID=UPI003267D923